MNLIILPFEIALRLWVALWNWTYPLARPAITEALFAAGEGRSLSTLFEMTKLALYLPIMARSQHIAERSAATSSTVGEQAHVQAVDHQSHMDRWRVEARWRSALREAVVWSTFASWTATCLAIGASFLFTGNFLFETHATAEAPGYVSNYFKVAALTFLLPFAVVPSGFALLRITRRSV